MIKYLKPLSLCFLIFLEYACSSTKKITPESYIYFNNGADTIVLPDKATVIQSGDLIRIRVYSSTVNQEQAVIFNIPNSEKSDSPGGYLVSERGEIEMPVIGHLKAAGLSPAQLQDQLEKKLANYVKNPSVAVSFLEFNINVLGEVHKPGIQKFSVDRVTVIDAIGSAGDLTDYGERKEVTVIRQENSKKIYQTIDLTSKSLVQSPVYLLQPNDIVYVKPNANKLLVLSANPESQRKTGIILSVIGILVSVASVVVIALTYQN